MVTFLFVVVLAILEFLWFAARRGYRCEAPLLNRVPDRSALSTGSISVAITLGANAARHHAYHPLTILAALIGMVLIAISILLCYAFADRLAQILGATGMTVITQLSSFFLVCIGVQIAWNGIKELLETVTLHIG
jgi:hypothetical protein